MNVILSVLLLWTIVPQVFSDECNERICRIDRVKKMRAADCYKRDLHSFPTCLQSNIEILDLSYNRIRKLKKGDLDNYPSLKLLYLSDNLIVTIEDGFFDSADSLVALDLSINGISELPPKVFELPSLSKLYLSQNANMNIIDVIEKAKPIKSPLSRLDISFNELETLPDLGTMLYLVEYNISGNDLTNLTPREFAGLCNLEFLYNSNMTVQFSTPCDCWAINNWLKERNVKFDEFECEGKFDEECKKIDDESFAIFEKCKQKYDKIVTQSKLVKIVLPCVLGVIVLILGIAYYWYRKRRQQKQVYSEVLNPVKGNDKMICEYNKNSNI